MEAILVIDDFEFLLGLLVFILGLLTAITGIYYYFKIEKKTHILLVGLGALFIMLAGLDSVTDFFRTTFISPWATTLNFIGILLIFISTEPWVVVRKLREGS
ncbi:MAG: hypothetical protein ACW981_01515 [Candidatus Hodarchaeales archaeon]|jgi:hypothetical protein